MIRDLFGVETTPNVDEAHTYVHTMDDGVVISVNAGNKDQSMGVAHMLASAFTDGADNDTVRRLAESQISKARVENRPFVCRVGMEVKLP